MKKKLLFIGDAACPSGFARATHEILDRLEPEYDITVLGINYRGDPHNYPYPIYAAAVGEDALGIGRLIWMCDVVKPDVIVIQNDGWFIPYYVAKLRKVKPSGEYYYPQYAAVPIVAAVAVDGKNFRGAWIKDVTMAVFWTQFALDEARIGGYTGPATVISLGVDRKTFHPVPKEQALARKGALVLKDMFVVGNVNRNQPRKRWDLTLKYFSQWVHSNKIKDAALFLHTAPTGDTSINVEQLAQYYGIMEHLVLVEPEIFYGQSDADMRDTYNCFDACITTTQGEGFGLTTIEAMACGVPCIVPEWAALGDWAKGGAMTVPCTSTAMQSWPSVNGSAVIGGVADEKLFITALDMLYRDKEHRKLVSDAGQSKAAEGRFNWDVIGQQWSKVLADVFIPEEEETPEIEQLVWREPEEVKVDG